MERWTDKAIKQHIEELIEESYLMSLEEPEIRSYLRNFIQSCEYVLKTKANVHHDSRITKVKIALLRSYLLINNGKSKTRTDNIDEDNSSRIKFLSRHVIQIKTTIMRLLDMANPELSCAVYEEFKRRNNLALEVPKNNQFTGNIYVEIGYYVLLVLAVMLLPIVILYW